MPQRTTPKIELSARVRKIVEEIAKRHSAEHRLVTRAMLVLAMVGSAGNRELARNQNLARGAVRYWRRGMGD